MNKEKISVIMGIYNCENTLKEAIESILNQTYKNWELIMCDDASTDSTYILAKEYVNKYPQKMILLKNNQNMKLAFTLNHCLKYATGEYIARMDGDDISEKERFEKQVSFLKNNPDLCVCGTSMQMFSDEGYGSIVYKELKPNRFTPRNRVPFNHATILAYKWVYDKLDGYTVSRLTTRAEDVDLWFRFYSLGLNGGNLSEPLYRVREDKNAIRRRKAKFRWYAFLVDIRGYNLLKYPWYWYYKPFSELLKIFVPVHVMVLYRKFQKKKQQKKCSIKT